MLDKFSYRLLSDKPFDIVVENLERETVNYKFKILHIHDVQKTLMEKGFERGPLKILELCNAGFAHKALQKEIGVALFMPCRITVHTEDGKTVVTLGRPKMISEFIPQAGLNELAEDVENTLIKIMEASI